jgi:hypothetical protein
MTRERDERMWNLAYRLAQSGEYRNYLAIEWQLRAFGYPQAPQLQPGRKTEAGHQFLQGQLEQHLRKEEDKAVGSGRNHHPAHALADKVIE